MKEEISELKLKRDEFHSVILGKHDANDMNLKVFETQVSEELQKINDVTRLQMEKLHLQQKSVSELELKFQSVLFLIFHVFSEF